MIDQINLDTPPPGKRYEVTVATVKDETKGELIVRLYKEVVLFTVTIILFGMVAYYCASIIGNEHSDTDSKKWAMSIISASIGGLVGYLVRR